MSVDREVIKSNWLQHKVRKKTGTLLRKKKILYEEAEWVVLCVHDGRIPLLEWYHSERAMDDHRPVKVVDLLDSAFVSAVISDPRSFIIGFSHSSRDAVELAALTPEDCQQWIRCCLSTLERLQCLGNTSNLYSSPPDTCLPDSGHIASCERNSLDYAVHDDIPQTMAPTLPSSSAPISIYEHLSMGFDSKPANLLNQNCSLEPPATPPAVIKRHPSFRETVPPLPPRRTCSSSSTVSPSRKSQVQSVYDFPKNCVPSPVSTYSTLERSSQSPQQSPTPNILPATVQSAEYSTVTKSPSLLTTEIAAPSAAVISSLVARGYSVPSPESNGTLSGPVAAPNFGKSCGNATRNGYDKPATLLSGPPSPVGLSTAIHFQSPEVVPDVKKRDLSKDQDDIPLPTKLTLSERNARLKSKTEIALQLTLCVEHIAFIEFDNKVWVAGWTDSSDKHLSGVLRLGDELFCIGNVRLENIHQIPALFYSTSIPGSPVKLTVCQIPYGQEFTLTKTSKTYDLGIILHKHKNKLADVVNGGAAYQAGIRARIPAVTSNGMTAAFVTHINGCALNLFSTNDELLSHVDKLPCPSKFSLIIHPYDFVKQLKRGLKKMKNYGKFVRS